MKKLLLVFCVMLPFSLCAMKRSASERDDVTQAMPPRKKTFISYFGYGNAGQSDLSGEQSLQSNDCLDEKFDQLDDEWDQCDEYEYPKTWFHVGDLISYLRERSAKPRRNPMHGYTFPQKLNLKNPFTHLVSFQQRYNTCGYNALANAHAIQKQVNEKTLITFDKTKQYAQELFENLFIQNYLDELMACAQEDDEEIGAILQIADGNQVAVMSEQGDLNPPMRGEISDKVNYFVMRHSLDYLQEIDPSGREQWISSLVNNSATHFLILQPGHFTQASVVKQGDNYRIYHLDSINNPNIDNTTKKFIQTIDGLAIEAKKRARKKR